ncbi:MAG: ABC transporter permease, partial [Pseudomonadota bacterium]
MTDGLSGGNTETFAADADTPLTVDDTPGAEAAAEAERLKASLPKGTQTGSPLPPEGTGVLP